MLAWIFEDQYYWIVLSSSIDWTGRICRLASVHLVAVRMPVFSAKLVQDALHMRRKDCALGAGKLERLFRTLTVSHQKAFDEGFLFISKT